MNNTIVNRNGKLSSVTGRGVEAFRLRCLISALRFRKDTGLEIDRRIRAIKLARAETGLRTRNIDALIVAVQEKLDAVIRECEVVNE